MNTEIQFRHPKPGCGEPYLEIRIPLSWPRVFRMWGRLGSVIRQARPDLVALSKEEGELE